MKTNKNHQQEIFSFISEIHSYECFEFAVYDIESVNQEYLKWIDEETK